MENLILSEHSQGVYIVTLNRVNKKNALNTDMYEQLIEHFTYANNCDEIRCLLIRGDDSCFCAGNDLADFMQFVK